ncbi:MAG: hypothetical protein AB7J40_01945 [Candidatus Altimarinota bacterium]
MPPEERQTEGDDTPQTSEGTEQGNLSPFKGKKIEEKRKSKDRSGYKTVVEGGWHFVQKKKRQRDEHLRHLKNKSADKWRIMFQSFFHADPPQGTEQDAERDGEEKGHEMRLSWFRSPDRNQL